MNILLVYAIVGILNIISHCFDLLWLRYTTILLLMPLLMLFLWKQSKINKKNKFIYSALFFSWIGDLCLMFPNNIKLPLSTEMLFVVGLSSFLIGHINYIVYYAQDIISYNSSLIRNKTYALTPFLLFIILFFLILFPVLGVLKIPVLCYGIILMSMVIMAFNRKGFVSNASFYFVFIGAFIFFISDSCIAINKFYKPFDLSIYIIMITYIAAQALIVYGVTLNKNQ